MNPSSVGIRDADANDVTNDATRVWEFIQPFVQAEQLLPRTLNEIRQLANHGFVAELAGQVVGFAAIEIYSKKMAELQCLAVSPSCQGQGVGKRLIEHCIARARREGIKELMTITSSERPFVGCGFHYSLPNQKRALFIQTDE